MEQVGGTIICSYFAGFAVSFFVLMIRHRIPWNGIFTNGYDLGFALLSYIPRQTVVVMFWPIALVIWVARGFPPAPYDFRLTPSEARAQGKRA